MNTNTATESAKSKFKPLVLVDARRYANLSSTPAQTLEEFLESIKVTPKSGERQIAQIKTSKDTILDTNLSETDNDVDTASESRSLPLEQREDSHDISSEVESLVCMTKSL